MIKNLLVVAAGLVMVALPTVGFAKSTPTLVAGSDLALICQQSDVAGDQDALLDLGNGNSVAITVHCDQTDAMVVGANTDTGESEKGPTEAAENGVED